jgi:hypothetical protein
MELNPAQRELLHGVPNDGSTIGNMRLRRNLRWSTDYYFSVRDTLVDAGWLELGRGQGGSVRRVSIDPDPPVVFDSELDLYEPLLKVISHEWARARRTEPVAVAITAHQGRARTGGTWTRPDITCVSLRTFTYVPGSYLDITTFEVKPIGRLDVRAVFEAVAHRRAATEVYVLAHTPFGWTRERLQPIADVAMDNGVGLIAVEDPANFETWDELVAPERFHPDPSQLDSFISTQLSDEDRAAIAARIRNGPPSPPGGPGYTGP